MTATRPIALDPHRPLVDLLSDRGLKHRKPLGSYPTRNQWAREVVEWLRDGMPAQGVTRGR